MKLFQAYRKLIVILGIVISTLLVYAQVIHFDFINIDDRAYIYENRAVLSGFNWNSVRWAFTEFYSANWHPLTWISHIIDTAIFGLNANGHHAVNVVFHTLNSILAFVVFRKLTGDFWKSAVVAFLFALHPAHVESVAWVAERKDVLSTMFWLLTMWAYFRYAETQVSHAAPVPKNKNKERSAGKIPAGDEKSKQSTTSLSVAEDSSRRFYLLTILFFAAGLMSKPMLVTLPFVLLLCDFWSLQRLKTLRDFRLLVIEKLPLFALVLISSFITFIAQSSAGAAVSLEAISLQSRLVNICLSYAKYIVMLFYPVNLGFWYPFEQYIIPLELIAAAALLFVVSIYSWQQRKKRKYLLMGWLWFLGTLVPVIGFVQVGLQGLADRYTYVPYFGLFIMLVWGTGDLFEHFKVKNQIAAAVCAIALLILGILAFQQTSHWRNSETLYTHTLSVTENNYFLMSNLCLHYLKYAAPQIAEKRCTELIEATPPTPEGQNILGFLRTETGKFDQAVANYQAAIKMRPTWGILYANLSETLARQGKPDEAEQYLQKALTIKDPSLTNEILARSSNNLASIYMQKKRTEKAIQYFNKALELQPEFVHAQENLKKAQLAQ